MHDNFVVIIGGYTKLQYNISWVYIRTNQFLIMMINIKRIVLVAAYRYEYYSAAFQVIKYYPFNHLARLAIKMNDAQVFVYVNFPKNFRLS